MQAQEVERQRRSTQDLKHGRQRDIVNIHVIFIVMKDSHINMIRILQALVLFVSLEVILQEIALESVEAVVQ